MSAAAAFEPKVPISHGDDDPIAYAECIRIARRLRTPGHAPVGLLPADGATTLSPVGIQLAAALVDVTASASAFVDAMARLAPPAVDTARAATSTRWLRSSLAVVTAAREHAPCAQSAAAREAIERAVARFHHVLVDLTGFERTGELATVLASIRRVVIVASAVATSERAVLEAAARVPKPKRLGVLLVG